MDSYQCKVGLQYGNVLKLKTFFQEISSGKILSKVKFTVKTHAFAWIESIEKFELRSNIHKHWISLHPIGAKG